MYAKNCSKNRRNFQNNCGTSDYKFIYFFLCMARNCWCLLLKDLAWMRFLFNFTTPISRLSVVCFYMLIFDSIHDFRLCLVYCHHWKELSASKCLQFKYKDYNNNAIGFIKFSLLTLISKQTNFRWELIIYSDYYTLPI